MKNHLDSTLMILAEARGLVPRGEEAEAGARLDALVRSGALSDQEVEDLISDLLLAGPIPDPTASGSWDLGRHSVRTPADGVAPEAPPVLPAHFQEVAFLGSGEEAVVYQARDLRHHRWVALKFLRGGDPVRLQAQLQAARAQARVDHPNVCRVYEVGEAQGRPYICMQRILGWTLAQLQDQLALEDKLRMLRDVAEGLHAAHGAGLLHLDLRPASILLERRSGRGWHPYLVDFARTAGSAGEVPRGTEPFASPEQAKGARDLDPRADVHGLGATLLVACTRNRPPLQPGRRPDPFGGWLREAPEDLRWVVRACLQARRDRRYPTALALADDLGRVMEGAPVRVRAERLGFRLATWARRHRLLAAAGACLTVLVLAGAGWGLAAARRAGRAQEAVRRSGADLARLRSVVRTAYLRPAHDLRPEFEEVRGILARLREASRSADAGIRRSALAALGRACLALEDLRGAKEAFEGAWAAGARDPELERDLGAAQVRLYLEELRKLAGDRTAEAAETRLALISDLKWPGLAHLGRARAEGAQALLLKALAEAGEGRAESACALAEQALAADPALYEALLLESTVLATEAWRTRGADGSARAYAALGRLEALAPSLPEAYAMEEALWFERARALEPTDPAAALADYRKCLAVAEAGLRVDPDQTLFHSQIMDVSRILGEIGPKEEAEAAFARACGEAELLVAREPEAPKVLKVAGEAYGTRALWSLNAGRIPRGDLQRAGRLLEAYVRTSHGAPAALRDLAWVAQMDGWATEMEGGDPSPDWRRALDAYRRVLAQRPGEVMCTDNMVELYVSLLDRTGPEPSFPDPLLAEAVAFQAAQRLEAAPRPALQANLAKLMLRQMKQDHRAGAACEAAYAQGEAACGRVLQKQAPPEAWTVRGRLRLEAARCARGLHGARRDLLRAAEADLLRAAALAPQDAAARAGLAEVCLERAAAASGGERKGLLAAGLGHLRAAEEKKLGAREATVLRRRFAEAGQG